MVRAAEHRGWARNEQGDRDKIPLGQWGAHGAEGTPAQAHGNETQEHRDPQREQAGSYPGVGHQQVPHCVALTLLLLLQLHRDVPVGHGAVGGPVLGTLLLREHTGGHRVRTPCFSHGFGQKNLLAAAQHQVGSQGFTDTQNHRTLWAGRDLKAHPIPNPSFIHFPGVQRS